MRCVYCRRDIDAIGQDNCSYNIGSPLCEDCAGITKRVENETKSKRFDDEDGLSLD